MFYLSIAIIVLVAIISGTTMGHGELVQALREKRALQREVDALNEDVIIYNENQEKLYEEIYRLQNWINANHPKAKR